MYNQSYVFYLIINALYLFSFPLSGYLNDNYDSITNYLFIYALISFFMLLIVPLILYKYKKQNIIKFDIIKPSYLSLKFIFLSLIVVLILKYLYFNTEISYSILFNRMNRELPFYQSQGYVIFILVMQYYFFFFIYNLKHLNTLKRIILLILFLIFAFHEIALTGARRFTLAIILFYLIYKVGFKRLFSIKYIMLGFTIVIPMFALGGFRELILNGVDELTFTKALGVALENNEFTEIGRGLYYYISYNMDMQILQGGKSFIDGLQFIIPRDIYSSKPVSLVSQFGVPVSIYSELFLNFHFFGAFVIFLYGVLYYVLSVNTGFWSIVFFSYVLDFSRSQFGAILYVMFVLYLLYLIFQVKYVYNRNPSI